MRRLLCLVVLLLAGCQTFVGPLQRRGQPRVRIDDPRLTIEEQQKRMREFTALPDPYAGPRTYTEFLGAAPFYR